MNKAQVQQQHNLGWPLTLLTPRELVLMLHHLSQVGGLYTDSLTCEAMCRLLRDRLRDVECQPDRGQASTQ